jgi:hypothetical protein
MAKKRSNRKPTGTAGRCRGCGKVVTVSVGGWDRPAGPRCPACGGVVDRVRASRP